MGLVRWPLRSGVVLPLRSGGLALCLKAEAGIAPRRAPHFLCLAKESKQRSRSGDSLTSRSEVTRIPKATRRARPAAQGPLRCSTWAGSRETRCAQTDGSPFSAKVCAARRARREGGVGNRRLLPRSGAVLFYSEGAAASQRGQVPALCSTQSTQVHQRCWMQHRN